VWGWGRVIWQVRQNWIEQQDFQVTHDRQRGNDNTNTFVDPSESGRSELLPFSEKGNGTDSFLTQVIVIGSISAYLTLYVSCASDSLT